MEITWRRIPALGAYFRAMGAAVVVRLRRQPSPEEAAADRFYEEADRWKLVEPETSEGTESMEAAARLYIARLKAAKGEDEKKREQR